MGLEGIGAVITAIIGVGVPLYIAAFTASSVVLFAPSFLAQLLGLAAFREMYRGYIGAVFVVSASLLAAKVLSAISLAVSNRLDDRRLQKLTLETLRMLTVDEKKFLRGFITDGKNTVHAPITDGVAGGLKAKGLIYRSSNIFSHIAAPYNLQPIARKLLTNNPQLLE